MLTPDVVAEHIKAVQRTSGGVSCSFWKIGDIGVKCYQSAEVRDWNFSLQKIASLHGIGPKCYNRFKIEGCYTYYCYSTQCVDMLLRDYMKANHMHCDYLLCSDRHPFHHVWLEGKAIGIVNNDDHESNYGLLNGKVMLIDYGAPHIEYLTYYRKRDCVDSERTSIHIKGKTNEASHS